MSDVSSLGAAEIRRLLDAHGVVPAKALGQNFVIDLNTTERIARLAEVGARDRVLEIGAGLGSLTRSLLQTGATITAVEVDHRLVDALRETLPSSVEIIQGDAMALDWPKLLDVGAAGRPWVLVANLPYNVAAPLVIQILIGVPTIGRMLVMVQREVGERLAARPGSKDYGAASVRVAYFASAQVVGLVPPAVFYPRPHVESALVSIERRPPPVLQGEPVVYEDLDQLVRAAFLGRRKMLRRSLAGLVAPETFVAAGIDPRARPEELDLLAWGKLAQCRRSIESLPEQS